MAKQRRRAAPARVVPRRTRGGLGPFGRRGEKAEGADLTDIGCPDCRGVLAVEERSSGQLAFFCRVGHAYSGQSLVVAKEDQLENALWSAVETYEEVAMLGREMAQRLRRAGTRAGRSTHEERARRATRNAATLRGLIGRDRPALLRDDGGPA